MKKFMYILMAAAAVAFVSCKKDDGKEKDKEKDQTPVEDARILEDFEGEGMLAWNGSNGCAFEVVDNPAKTGINTSNKVGKYTTAEAQWDFVWTTGFGANGDSFDFLDFSAKGFVIKVDVYAPKAGIPIYCKLEGVGVDPKEITSVVTKKAGEWDTLEWDYETMGVVDGAYKNFVFCVDAGGTTPDIVVYLDNVRQTKSE